jgi:WhiB family redox-sensing transcriptional regulator
MSKRPPNFDHAIARDIPPVAKYEDAACRTEDPEIFFPVQGARPDEARAICRSCPHVEPCLEWAVETEQAHGVWGGTSAYERAQLIEKRKGPAA